MLVYNPHPYPVKTIVECEFNLADFNYSDAFTDLQVYKNSTPLPTQVEKEGSNLNLDWRKRIAFVATLAPSQMTRFVCQARPTPLNRVHPQPQGNFHFESSELEVVINECTGLLDTYRVQGIDYLDMNACNPLVMLDNSDPWGMLVKSFRNLLGGFSLLSSLENQRFSGVANASLAPVRIIEDGEVRTVVEAVLGYADSRIVLRYKLPKNGTEIEIEARVHWNEKDRMLKLAFPTPDKHSVYIGQVAYGVEKLPANGNESVAQKWVAVLSEDSNSALTIINDGIYGSDFCYGEVRLSLLRSPGYSTHPIGDRPHLPTDRYSPRIDQGERLYRFWINGGPSAERLAVVDREALAHNEKPMALSFFPQGAGQPCGAFVTISDESLQIPAIKPADDGQGIILRIFNPTAQDRNATIALTTTSKEVVLRPFEIRTYRVQGTQWIETNLMEEPLPQA